MTRSLSLHNSLFGNETTIGEPLNAEADDLETDFKDPRPVHLSIDL